MQIINSLIERAYAVDVGVCIPTSGGCISSFPGWVEYVEAIYDFSLKAGGVLVTLMVVYAGYMYMTSAGDTTKLSAAKDITFGAIIGYIVLLMVGPILKFLLAQ